MVQQNSAANGNAKRRSSTAGRHVLLPASNSHGEEVFVPLVPTRSFASWTFGRGTVVWTIWPAVLLHTIFAAVITTISLKTDYYLGVPPVLITVLGVVIGFVIAYRASSGHDRYWAGRSAWADLIKNARTLDRLIWFHVPTRLTPKTQAEIDNGKVLRGMEEIQVVMKEKRIALDLVEGFAVAVKHHLRGEMGIYYEDLYHLVKPLHNHPKFKHHRSDNPNDAVIDTEVAHHPTDTANQNAFTVSDVAASEDPIIPAINQYGSFEFNSSTAHQRRSGSTSTSSSSSDSDHEHEHKHRYLLPSYVDQSKVTIWSKVSAELIPFAYVYHNCVAYVKGLFVKNGDAQWADATDRRKHRPRIAGGGENVPLEVLRCLSEWLSVLEERGTVQGNGLGGMFGCITNFEISLSTMECILTTPLPFIYSAHIRHAVWLYLFLLPFQLIDQFGWHTIPGTGIAAFFYMGFLAAGEEIEQPFGYDENDLELDLFCREIVHTDIEGFKKSSAHNAYLGTRHSTGQLIEIEQKDTKPQNVFGTIL